MRDWKLENLLNGKEISVVPFRMEKEEYLWRYSTISERNFRKITLPFDFKPKFPDFFGQMVSTLRRPIQLRGRPILLITGMNTDRIGLHSVL